MDFKAKAIELHKRLISVSCTITPELPIIVEALRSAYEEGLDDAEKLAEECGRTNVENPVIDMYEVHRRSGIRWCGEWIVRNIRALKSSNEAPK